MIVDPNSTTMATSKDDMQAPPSYDETMKDAAASGPFVAEGAAKADQVKVPIPPAPSHSPAGPSSRIPSMPTTTVYNYVNPATGEHVVSLLPPDHPQMVCLQQGGHVPSTRYGVLGILAAIIWFPVGIACCLLDRRVKCARCGLTIDEGVCA